MRISQINTQQVREIATFAVVGLSASVVHLAVALFLIERLGMAAWVANIEAFLIALPVSYVGHSILTFSASRYNRRGAMTWKSARRFFLMAFGGFALNQMSVVLFVSWMGLPHRPVLFLTVFGVAAGLFLAGKFWAFRGAYKEGIPQAMLSAKCGD